MPRLIALLCLFLVLAIPAHAAPKDPIELTAKTWLAYVETGDHDVDHVSEAGLKGLAHILQQRTSIDFIDVAGVDPDHDELAFYPLLYWPLTPGQKPLTPDGARRVNDYLHHGGMILFDSAGGSGQIAASMQVLMSGVDIPPLQRLPAEHVLKRSFYLIDEFPGRYAGGEFWLEPEQVSSHDGVATVLAGSNDWAGAWAVDDSGRPLFACTPGGEEQRERARRFGVNLVMYALTGNYKSDQVHAQALLERMGK